MTAVISECEQYRYLLKRPAEVSHPKKGPAVFIMLNPSTADESIDDPTIRRCRGFAKSLECNGLVVANLYALRATNPKELSKHPDPFGPFNHEHLNKVTDLFEDIICAWGTNARPIDTRRFMSLAAEYNTRLWCLGTTKDGSPRHPLYVRADKQLEPWGIAEEMA